MKSRSVNLNHADEREGACTRRRSPTSSEPTQRPGTIIRRSMLPRPSFSPSPSPMSSSTIQELYPHFLKLFRHSFGNKRSPYRKQSQAWLSSLGNNNICSNCWQTRWKCDTQGLRCQPCIEKHATCPRTLQFKKFLILREMDITDDVYDRLVKLIPRARNRRRGIGFSGSSHPPARQSQEARQKSTQNQATSVASDVESEEVDELDPTEPSSDDLPLQSKLSSKHNQPIEATRLTQVRPARVTFRTTNRGPTSSPTSNSNPPAPTVMANLDSARVVDELSGIRLALTRMEEHLLSFFSNHAKSQPPAMAGRGTHIILPSPIHTTVLESPPAQNSELYATTSRMNIVDSRAAGEDNEVKNTQQLRRPMNDRVLDEPSDSMIFGARFMTPPHVLPTIATLGGGNALADIDK